MESQKRLRLEGTSGGHMVQPLAQAGTPTACPGACSDGFLTCFKGDSTASLNNLFQFSVKQIHMLTADPASTQRP